jgi:hypothetical protein
MRRVAEAFQAWARNPVGPPPNPFNLPPTSPPHSTVLSEDQKEQDESSEK